MIDKFECEYCGALFKQPEKCLAHKQYCVSNTANRQCQSCKKVKREGLNGVDDTCMKRIDAKDKTPCKRWRSWRTHRAPGWKQHQTKKVNKDVRINGH